MKDVTPRQRHRSPLVMGVVLILAGVLLLMLNLGYGIPPGLWDYWPLAFIVLGLVGIAAPSRHLSRSGGIWMLAVGLYCEISVLQLFDLGWSSAWPIFIIGAGLSVILDPRGRRPCFDGTNHHGMDQADEGGPGPGQTGFGQSGR